jgi:hypothetical protein
MGLEFETTVFYTCVGEALARAYLIVTPTTDVDRDTLSTFRISGQVVGPTCRYSSTLQTKISLVHFGLATWGDRSALAAEAVVTDPCYWSTELPFLYRAVGSIDCGDGVPVALEQTFGMRDLRVFRTRFVLNGKVWVPRIVYQHEVPADTPIEAWRDANTVMLAVDPSDKLLREASEIGVAMVTGSASGQTMDIADVRRMSRFPAVAMTLIESTDPLEPVWQQAATKLLLARWYDERVRTAEHDFTDAYFVRRCEQGPPDEQPVLEWPTNVGKPLVAVAQLSQTMALVEARAACDQLQGLLAGKCDAAGYAV